MERMQKAAIEVALVLEIRCLTLYRALSSKVADITTRRMFELLAQTSAEHLESFCSLYTGNDRELIALLGSNSIYSDPYYCGLLSSDCYFTTSHEALQIALKEEQSCIEWYTVFADTIQEPHIRNAFERILNETNEQCEIISAEYTRINSTIVFLPQISPRMYVRRNTVAMHH